MKSLVSSYSFFSGLNKYRIRAILFIAVAWTLIDIMVVLLLSDGNHKPFKFHLVRESAVFIISGLIGYLFVFALKNVFRTRSPLYNFVFKSMILIGAAFFITFLIHFADNLFFDGLTYQNALQRSLDEVLQIRMMTRKVVYWLILFAITQLFIEINEKYSPGVFIDILIGKYTQPKIENRIIMFMDLKDSTPIAEKLGHVENFKFIRDFIYHVSMAIIEHDGRIYQYVGDEIVVSWVCNKENTAKCMAAIIDARKNLQKNGHHFRNSYGIIPEFRVGLHIGDVTVGQIGVIKKDLAMSGDTMNTTARIRSACNELNQKFIMSKDFMDNSDLKQWQGESLGIVDLKGKQIDIELFAIKI